MKNTTSRVLVACTLAMLAPFAMAKEPQISSNTSGIDDADFLTNITNASVGMGAAEPLSISSTQNGGKLVVVVTGSNGTSCKIPTSNGNPPQMQGINCK